jgi:putative ABC transport system permease protein
MVFSSNSAWSLRRWPRAVALTCRTDHVSGTLGTRARGFAAAGSALVLVAITFGTVAVKAREAGDLPGVLLSRQLAESRGLRVGDVVRLGRDPSGDGGRSFRIVGIYGPTPDPMRFARQRFEARLHLPDLLSIRADGSDVDALESVGAINVALKQSADAESFARDVAARVPGIVARPTSAPDERTGTFVVLERFHLAIAIVTVLGSAVFLLALMVMLVDERRATVGILRLIGFTRRRILFQMFAEGALIATAGALFGIVFAFASQRFFNAFFQWRYDTTLVFLRITPDVVWLSLLLSVPLGVAASLVASWSLVRQRLLALIRR